MSASAPSSTSSHYLPSKDRYANSAFYRRCGRSGLLLPALSLGLWHNFGEQASPETARSLVTRAFDLGITHFDLANNYGPPAGFSEELFGRLLRDNLKPWRDEILISTKAGYDMWSGPYGTFGSRKHLLASADQSLRRLGLDYVDIFYHHRPDPQTPLEESMGALAHLVRQGKALYIGLSNYGPAQAEAAFAILRQLGTPCVVHQPRYHLFDRAIEQGLTTTLERNGVGSIVFCPLAQGLLTNRYLDGIPPDSRACQDPRFLKPTDITEDKLHRIRALNTLALERGQSLAQMSLAWVLRNPVVTSAIIGASRPAQLEENVAALSNPSFTAAELERIEAILGNGFAKA